MFCLYINTDDTGNITDSYYGQKIIPDRQYDFFFCVDQATAENAFNYKVTLNGIKPQLELK